MYFQFKSKNYFMKKKLEIKKKVITPLTKESLTKEQTMKIVGGDAAFTTSYFSCTGWNCCERYTTPRSCGPTACY